MVASEVETVDDEEGRKETEEPNFAQPLPRVRPVSTMCRLRCMDEEQVTCGRRDDLSFGPWLH